MYKYKLVLLDADGTILDFNKAEYGAIYNTFGIYNIEQSKANIDAYVNINIKLWKALELGEIDQESLKIERFRRLLKLTNNNINYAEDMAKSYLIELMKGKQLLNGALDFVQNIYKSHTICVITNGITNVQYARFSNNPISKYINKIYISEEVGAAKPNPKMIFDAMNDNYIKNVRDVLVIGDSISSDIAAANKAGVDSVLISNNINIDYKKSNYIVSTIRDAVGIALITN